MFKGQVRRQNQTGSLISSADHLIQQFSTCLGERDIAKFVQNDEMLFFEVADQGCGMPDEFIQNRLFQPFQTTKQKGFGVGLYQCRQIIEAHGGRIDVSSKVDEGTTFTVYLPRGEG